MLGREGEKLKPPFSWKPAEGPNNRIPGLLMTVLYHLWLSPFSRKIRLALDEKNIPYDMVTEPVWERREEFLTINPAGDVPVLVESDGQAVVNSWAICEYLEETRPEPPLLGHTPPHRAEVRRLVAWFDEKFNREVTQNLVGEKIMKRFLSHSEPDSKAIRAGLTNIRHHLDYVTYLVERRNWLAGERLTYADLAAGAHLSCVDYLGDVPWDTYPEAKTWYARLKSRPAFRDILNDSIPGAAPAPHYRNLDF